MSPALLPVGGEPLEHELHEAADEVGARALRQDQQAGIVGDQRPAAAALLGGPPDELVAVAQVQGRRTPGGQRQPPATIHHRLAQRLADEPGVVEVMMLDDELVAPRPLLGTTHQDHPQVIQDMLLAGSEGNSLRLTHPARLKNFGKGAPQNQSSLSTSVPSPL